MDINNSMCIQWLRNQGNRHITLPLSVEHSYRVTLAVEDVNSVITIPKCSMSSKSLSGFYVQTCWYSAAGGGWGDLGFEAIIIGH